MLLVLLMRIAIVVTFFFLFCVVQRVFLSACCFYSVKGMRCVTNLIFHLFSFGLGCSFEQNLFLLC
jgi:hypothetical protein